MAINISNSETNTTSGLKHVGPPSIGLATRSFELASLVGQGRSIWTLKTYHPLGKAHRARFSVLHFLHILVSCMPHYSALTNGYRKPHG